MKKFENKKAEHNYYFMQQFEAGIALTGTEIKSVREGKVSFKDSYAKIIEGELWLVSLHISPYEKGSIFNHEPERKRKLLLHRWEIKRIEKKIEEKGLTVVPRELILNEKGLVKVVLAIAKGKHTYDKRDTIKERAQKRDMERKVKSGDYN